MSVEAYAPNMRFGTSFLDFEKHKKMEAVNDEVLMDKRTGQLVYKRDTDGKLIYFAQENFHLNTYIRQLKTLMTNNRKTYIKPNSSNCDYCADTYFLSYNIEMVDFEFDDSYPTALVSGGILRNPFPERHSFIQETNGFFFQLNGRPRDRAILSYLTALYDKAYKNYDGEDPDALARKAQYEIPGFDNSNAVVNYTVAYYDSDDRVVAETTSDGYVRANEVSYVPFTYSGIYPRSRVAYAKIRINSVSTPKISHAYTLLQTDNERLLLDSLVDSDDLGFISCNVSIFICLTDREFNTPTPENTIPMLVMGWEEFEEELVRAKQDGGSSGIIIDEVEPDPTDWEDITIWGEIIRYILPDGTETETDHDTNIDDIENGYTSTIIKETILTTDQNDIENYWVELFGPAFPTTT